MKPEDEWFWNETDGVVAKDGHAVDMVDGPPGRLAAAAPAMARALMVALDAGQHVRTLDASEMATIRAALRAAGVLE